MSEPKPVEFATKEKGKSMKLPLFRLENPGKMPVLLLHGASANHLTFLNPVGTAEDPRSLAEWLFKAGFEPWLLNWCGHGTIDRAVLHDLRDQLDFDRAATVDIPAVLTKIREVTRAERVCAVAHCMGAASLAQAIAGGSLEKHPELTHVVLLAIGLFYEPAMDGRLRSQDYALERMWGQSPKVDAVDPRPGCVWPEELDTFYKNWPADLHPHTHPQSPMDEVCNRVSFMFGQPYREQNLPRMMHEPDFLAQQFGAIPLRMYIHGAQNVRRGWAAPYGAKNSDTTFVDRVAQLRFTQLKKVTLITGVQNQIWHRDSIDRMYEWLNQTRAGRNNSHREILQNYAHQDLLWGESAYKDVFPLIAAGLPEEAERTIAPPPPDPPPPDPTPSRPPSPRPPIS